MALTSKDMQLYGYDLLLGLIAAFYLFMAPFTKVEESFNIQAMHDILYHRHHVERYDHLEFPGVVPRTFVGAILVSILASPFVLVASLLRLPKIYSLYAVRLALGCIILSTLRFFRLQIRKNFGSQVEAFFVILTVLQFHVLFYCTRPIPNILAFGLVNLAYGFWFNQRFYAALRCLMRHLVTCLTSGVGAIAGMLCISDFGEYSPPCRSISIPKALISCLITSLACIGLTILVDSVFWRRLLWPELEVFWFNSILSRSSEWGTHVFHWYFTSALPRSLLAAYPLFLLGILLDRRVWFYIFPVLSFVLLYSNLPHKELRFIIGSLPMFNFSAAVAASRVYNNRKKSFWKYLYIAMLGGFMISLGCTFLIFMASYENYPSGHAIKALHKTDKWFLSWEVLLVKALGLAWVGHDRNACMEFVSEDHAQVANYLRNLCLKEYGNLIQNSNETWVHIDTFSAINGVSLFCENYEPWRYSKEEGIPLGDLQRKKFTYLISEQSQIDGFECLFSSKGFTRSRLYVGFPPIILVKEPRVFVHGRSGKKEIFYKTWPGC